MTRPIDDMSCIRHGMVPIYFTGDTNVPPAATTPVVAPAPVTDAAKPVAIDEVNCTEHKAEAVTPTATAADAAKSDAAKAAADAAALQQLQNGRAPSRYSVDNCVLPRHR